jgi:hypothetical protein
MNPGGQPSSTAPPSGNLVPDFVGDIPVKTQAGEAGPVNDDTELDHIMQEVGKDVKKVGQGQHKKHFDFFKHKSKQAKAEPKFHAQPMPAQKVPAARPAVQPKPAQPTAAPKAASKIKSTAQLKPAKPPKSGNGAPIMAIIMTIIVTGALIAAAFAAYK